MKIRIFQIAVIFTFISTITFAQNYNSIGLVSSNLVNIENDNKISDIEHPFGYGFIFGRSLSDNVTAAVTFEYVKGNLENNSGEQKDYRAHVSVFVTPIKFGKFAPYFSGGAVISQINTTLNNQPEEKDTRMFGRFGLGVDYQFIDNFAINVDFGFYSNGLKFNGMSNSIGLRFIW